MPHDNSPHIQALLSEILNGDHGPINDYIQPSQEEVDAEAAENVRVSRNAILLSVVDPIVSNPLRWADLTSEQQAAWAAYRTALLDVPQQSGFPHNVTWPTKP